jgi:hypothetical protein
METSREVRAALEAYFGPARIDTTTSPSKVIMTVGASTFSETESGRLHQYRKTKAEAAALFVNQITERADHLVGSHRLVWRSVPQICAAPGPMYAVKSRFYFEAI